MIRILEALESLPADTALRARTDRRPVHLLPMLASRGFRGDTTPDLDHGYTTIIRRTA